MNQDGKRKTSVIQFLIDVKIINHLKNYLKGADLSGANLSDVNLSGANLEKANLEGANGANLKGAIREEFSFEKFLLLK